MLAVVVERHKEQPEERGHCFATTTTSAQFIGCTLIL